MSGAHYGMGMGAGVVTFICVFGVQMTNANNVWRVVLGAGAIAGIVSFVAWARDLQARCERYEEALRKHGIEMD
jgi:hypothetical protein